MEKEIIDLYQDSVRGFTNAQDIYLKLNRKYKLKDVKEVIKNIGTAQVFQKKKKDLDLIPIAAPKNSYQMDLLFYDKLKKFNSGYIGMLTIINMNTRKSYVQPIKSKSAVDVSDALQNFLQDLNDGVRVQSISFEKGKEFVNKHFNEIFSKKGIQKIVFDKSLSPNATMIIERFNQTIRQRIDKYLDNNQTRRYIDVLQDLTENYNYTSHAAIGTQPEQLHDDHLDTKAHVAKFEKLSKLNGQYQEGTKIRIMKENKQKDIFKKGRKNFSNQLFNVKKSDGHGFIVQGEDDQKDERRVLPFEMLLVNDKKLKRKEKNQKEKSV